MLIFEKVTFDNIKNYLNIPLGIAPKGAGI